MRKAIQVKIKVKELLQMKGWTQRQLSEFSGLREATISEIANAQRSTLNKEQLCILATAFDCEVGDLIEFIWAEEKKKGRPRKPQEKSTEA